MFKNIKISFPRKDNISSMDGAHHPAWRELIIPFLDDQQQLDQLYCSSKYLQQLIPIVLSHITCWCRPIDSVVKTAGIYPSYIRQMTKLRSLTVLLDPHLKYTWRDYTNVEARAHEIFSDLIPLTLQYFETDVNLITWEVLKSSYLPTPITQTFTWLDRFPNITIGPQFKGYLSKRIPTNNNVIIEHPQWLRHQFITSVSVSKLKQLVEDLDQSGKDVWISTLNKGITHVRTDRFDPTTLALEPADDPDIRIYQELPNLEEITGFTRYLPLGIRKYVAAGHGLSTYPLLSKLPQSLESLWIPWHMLNFEQLQFSSNLTELNITSPYTNGPYITVEQFNTLIKLLPPRLRSLSLENLYPPYQVAHYWPIENILALPRVLDSFYCVPYTWSWETLVPEYTTALLKALPQYLTRISLFDKTQSTSQHLDHTHIMSLPSSLTRVILDVNHVTAAMLANNIRHFHSLKILYLDIDLSQPFFFPNIILQATVEKLFITVTDPGSNDWSIPLQDIEWPEEMTEVAIKVNTRTTAVQIMPNINISVWNLPRTLMILSIFNIADLPFSWPEGLRSFLTSYNGDVENKDPISKVWPDISRMLYYFPHPSICHSEVIATSTVTRRSTQNFITTDPSTGRPKLKY